MKVLVTGGAGFIGATLCERLRSHPTITDVVALDDLSTGSCDNLVGVDATLVVGTFLDDDLLDRIVPGIDAIVHLGARPSVPRSLAEPLASHEANATGTVKVLEAARRHGVDHVVVASSSSVYGANAELPKRESMVPMPVSPYAVSKLATEQYALAWQHSFGLRTLAFRFFNVFGPRQAAGHAYAAVVPAFVDAALRGVPVTVHGDGTQSRDFTSVHTVCDVLTAAVVGGVSHPTPVNLAFGSRITLLHVLDTLEHVLGRPVARAHVASRPGDVPHSQADNSVLRSLFPHIEPVDFEPALRDTVEWHRRRVAQPA